MQETQDVVAHFRAPSRLNARRYLPTFFGGRESNAPMQTLQLDSTRSRERTFVLPAGSSLWQRPIPVAAIILLALAIHGPLLVMELPATTSYDANLHIFFASHYAHHWFNPWNEKWFAGFSQTTYPPLTHQWIALISNVFGLKMAYMLVQLIAVLLLPVGVYRFARIWVDDRAASYAALGTVFLGSLSFLVYQAGQLATVASAALYLNALPYFYEWMTEASARSLIKGIAVSLTAAAAHHVTLIFGLVLFAG